MSVLDKIVKDRKESLKDIRDLSKSEIPRGTKDVISALKRKSKGPSLISEIKRKSPSKGEINPGMTVEKAIDLYQPYASAISVLTEPKYFGGSLDDLAIARTLTDLPLLRKDFIIDLRQITEARYYGADFFLLIQGALDRNQMAELLDAGRVLGMPALVEVHDEKELDLAMQHDIQILGINNRSLIDLTINLETTQNLVNRIPQRYLSELIIVSESGIENKDQIMNLPQAVDAILVGTAFMKSSEPETLLKSLFA
jgi:indole-3-glycerol phosphate synthase